MAEIPIPTVEQAGAGAVYLTEQAGISTTILAVVAISLALGLVVAAWWCRKALREQNAEWIKAVASMQATWLANQEEWKRMIGNYRSDIKEAFNQNDEVADKMVEAMNAVKLEIARMSGVQSRDR